jgi:hypothetical protein
MNSRMDNTQIISDAVTSNPQNDLLTTSACNSDIDYDQVRQDLGKLLSSTTQGNNEFDTNYNWTLGCNEIEEAKQAGVITADTAAILIDNIRFIGRLAPEDERNHMGHGDEVSPLDIQRLRSYISPELTTFQEIKDRHQAHVTDFLLDQYGASLYTVNGETAASVMNKAYLQSIDPEQSYVKAPVSDYVISLQAKQMLSFIAGDNRFLNQINESLRSFQQSEVESFEELYDRIADSTPLGDNDRETFLEITDRNHNKVYTIRFPSDEEKNVIRPLISIKNPDGSVHGSVDSEEVLSNLREIQTLLNDQSGEVQLRIFQHDMGYLGQWP